MGYRTDFVLDFYNYPSIAETSEEYETLNNSVKAKLEEVSTYYWEGFELCDATWYKWKDDMKVVSESFPNVLFTLWGNGEGSEDIWVAYIKNGKVQLENAEIVYPAFDESKMV